MDLYNTLTLTDPDRGTEKNLPQRQRLTLLRIKPVESDGLYTLYTTFHLTPLPPHFPIFSRDQTSSLSDRIKKVEFNFYSIQIQYLPLFTSIELLSSLQRCLLLTIPTTYHGSLLFAFTLTTSQSSVFRAADQPQPCLSPP